MFAQRVAAVHMQPRPLVCQVMKVGQLVEWISRVVCHLLYQFGERTLRNVII